ncbi:MAG: hypothetical protein UT32_C0035G0001 [Parcubacteria group bacterium GW2011_GWC2_39_14]|nr:MAG: hypothetical protein UT32_C0035G0001 [Parcubacteria group bacterium GW2011_GWC2_39_14]KKR53685.1 MAG: hypothetical protein UT91_C0024G0008 [Parcubacteria group bacterium GW2011_GWA2_40_23]
MGFIFVPPPGRSFGKDFADAVSDTSRSYYFGSNSSDSSGEDVGPVGVLISFAFVGACLGVTLILLFALWEVWETVLLYTTGITFVISFPITVSLYWPGFTYEAWKVRKHLWRKRLIIIFIDIPTFVVVAEFAFVAGAVVFGFVSYCVLFFIAPFTGWSVEYALSVLVLTTKYFAFLISLGAVIWRYFAEFS